MFFSANHQFLELFLETKTDLPQVTALTETWLKAYMGFGILKLAGYQSIETMNRNRRDGGVAFYVSEGISYNKVKKLLSNEMQIVTILCENGGEKNIITVFYKVPQMNNCKFLDHLQLSVRVEKATRIYAHCMLRHEC